LPSLFAQRCGVECGDRDFGAECGAQVWVRIQAGAPGEDVGDLVHARYVAALQAMTDSLLLASGEPTRDSHPCGQSMNSAVARAVWLR
jgi:hypothetical protein